MVIKMKHINLFIPKEWIKRIDRLVEENVFPNRSEAIRVLLRDGMKKNGIWSEVLETVNIHKNWQQPETVTKKEVLAVDSS